MTRKTWFSWGGSRDARSRGRSFRRGPLSHCCFLRPSRGHGPGKGDWHHADASRHRPCGGRVPWNSVRRAAGRRSPLETRGSREKLDWCPERRVARGAVPAARRGIGRLPLRRYLPPGRHEVGREASGCRVSPWRREYHGKRFARIRRGSRAESGVIVVAVQYRLGALGFLSLPNSGKPRGTSRSPISRKRSAG